MKNMPIRKRLSLIGIIMSLIAGLVAGIDMIGETATTPNVLIVFFTGVAGGASLVSYFRGNKKK